LELLYNLKIQNKPKEEVEISWKKRRGEGMLCYECYVMSLFLHPFLRIKAILV